MSPIAGSSENLLKSRSLKLVPKMCIAIGFVRQTSSSAGSPSSMSVSSDQPQCDHYELNGTASRFSGGMTPKSPPTTRQFTFGEQSTGSTPSDSTASPPQSSPVDRQSFSSFSTGTTTTYNRECLCQQSINCAQLFSEFVRENLLNTCFVLPTNSFSKIDIAGFLYPCTLLVSGQADSLKLLCSLWSRRILKAPLGYSIRFLGTTSVLEVTPINQAQFTPLAEALHRCVDELNSLQQDATFEAIVRQCLSTFPTMELPVEEILKSSLSNLVTENKLSFDKQRQVYTATRTLLTPWDEFERLTLSENFKTEREEDDIELEYKNLHGENLNKCANFEQLIYLNTSADNSKSNTLSTENSFIDEPHFEGKGSNLSILLRRNSSLSNQIEQSTVNSELRRANFKRSKSLKLNYKPNGENRVNELLRKDCTCNEIIIKRESLFSKLLKFGHSNGNLKSRSVSASSVKFATVGSQCPEENEKGALVPLSENQRHKQVELHSKTTQTVKCGPEDIVTLIMKQAGRHALARGRPSPRQLERINHVEGCNGSQKCPPCTIGGHYFAGRHRESRNGPRRSRSSCKNYSVGENGESVKCLCSSNGGSPELASCKQARYRESKHRKLRSSSTMRYYRPSEWLIDYESSAKVTEKQLLRRGAHSHTCQHSDADDEDPNEGPTSSYTDNPMDRFACKGPKTLTVETNDANYSKKKINGHWLQSEENGAAAATAGQANGADKGNIFATLPTGLPHGGNLLISNSLNLKIEIETSSLLPTVPHSQGALNGGLSAGKHSMSGGIHLSSDRKGYATVHLTNGKKMDGNAFEGTLPPNGNQFANDIYSELTFDRHTHKLSRVLSPGAVASGYGCDPSYSADLNYSNSIVALKEQIARAKANFFNAPLSSTR